MEHYEGRLIPPPGVVRDRLARNLRENRLLRSLLRVSERAAKESGGSQDAAPSAPGGRPGLSGQEGRPW